MMEVRNFAEVMRKIIASLITGIAAVTSAAAADVPFVNTAAPSRFIDFEIHGLIGTSVVTQNYRSCFPQISRMALSGGVAGGAGARARTWFSDFVGLGIEINFLANSYSNNLAVADDDATSITNVFVGNKFYTINVPVYVVFNFNVSSNIRWNVDFGGYYGLGLGGHSNTTLYSAQVNPVGQLITTITNDRTPYYNSSEKFIASSHKADIGLHLGTGLTFRQLISIGLRMEMGLRNVAHAYDAIKVPNVHNFNFFGTIGWCF